MSIQLIFILGAAVLFNYLSTSVGVHDECPCSTQHRLNLGCEYGTQSRNKDDLVHYHRERGLYGDCLPQVEPNTMTCFKWSTKMCLNTEGADEICKLSPKPKLNMAIMPKDEEQSRTFFSPGIHRNRNYNRIFCIYNVTLKCPGRQAILSAKERTLPFGENCGDYLAIYTDPSNPIPKEKVCGNEIDPNFKMTLNSNTFLAILWTNRKTSSGKFEIEAKCGDMIQDHDEGSGDMLINTTVTTYKD